jgi:hypothetical protein
MRDCIASITGEYTSIWTQLGEEQHPDDAFDF